MNILEKILNYFFKKYVFKVYQKGIRDGFNWKN